MTDGFVVAVILTPLFTAAKTRITPRGTFERQVVVLLRIVYAKPIDDIAQKRRLRQGYTLRAVPVGDMEYRLVVTIFETRFEHGRFEQTAIRNFPCHEQPARRRECKQIHLHPHSHHAARDIDDMNGKAWHG